MKLPIEAHKMKWPNLERNIAIALWAGLILGALVGLYLMTSWHLRGPDRGSANQQGHTGYVDVRP